LLEWAFEGVFNILHHGGNRINGGVKIRHQEWRAANEEDCTVQLGSVDAVEEPADLVVFAQRESGGFQIIVASFVHQDELRPVEFVLPALIKGFHKASIGLVSDSLVLGCTEVVRCERRVSGSAISAAF
jgi:hypothetical protein